MGVEPTGAFYVFADARRFCERSYDFAFEILAAARVAVTPGIDFGPGGEGYLRFSYANGLPKIREALARLGEFLRDRRPRPRHGGSGVTPWDVRLARVLVRPLRHTPLTPNALTTFGIFTSLAAAWLMASGDRAHRCRRDPFMFAVLVDHMDGEFARLTELTSRFGHYYDHVAAAVGYVSLFVGLGIGLRSGWLDAWAPVAGGVAAGSIAAIFLIRVFLEETAGRAMVAQGNWHGFEPEDALYLVGPVAWLGAPDSVPARGRRWRAAVPPLGGVVGRRADGPGARTSAGGGASPRAAV